MREFRPWIVAAVLVMASGRSSTAQTEGQPPVASAAQTDPGVLCGSRATISLKTQAPFSAVIKEEKILFDGTKITPEDEVVVRDREGRVYREEHIPAPGFEKSYIQITISDPGRHFQYICHQESKTCTEVEFKPITGVRVPTKADGGHFKHPVTLEDLGTRSFYGVTAEGLRITDVVPSGEIGNDRAITLTSEQWWSEELGIKMEAKVIDPRTGTVTITMSDVSTGEPDPKYFGVPEGYTLTDVREQIAKAKGAQ
jgi:hypothetical protein